MALNRALTFEHLHHSHNRLQKVDSDRASKALIDNVTLIHEEPWWGIVAVLPPQCLPSKDTDYIEKELPAMRDAAVAHHILSEVLPYDFEA